MVDDLHRLIDKTIGTSPLILVGVDYSTLIARFYAQFYERFVLLSRRGCSFNFLQ